MEVPAPIENQVTGTSAPRRAGREMVMASRMGRICAMVKGVLFIQRLLAGPRIQCRGSSGPHTSTHPRSPAHRTSRRCSPRSEYQQPGFVCRTHSIGRIAGIYDGADPFFAGQALYHIQYKDLIVEVKPCFGLVPEQVRIQP